MVNDNGEVIERRDYDPFGKPRKGNTQDQYNALPFGASILGSQLAFDSQFDTLITNRGFTDHEHLDDFELIHMNGRAYDYNLGRFLSVDPFVQAPGNSQSMNPYSYIMNNPLSGTDPSGYKSICEGRSQLSCKSYQVNDKFSISVALKNGKTIKVNTSARTLDRDVSSLESISTRDIDSIKLSGHAVPQFTFVKHKSGGTGGRGITVTAGNNNSSTGNNDPNSQFNQLAGRLDDANQAGGYDSWQDAEIAALNTYNRPSIDTDQEYGGGIVEIGGKYFFTIPNVGKVGVGKVDMTYNPYLLPVNKKEAKEDLANIRKAMQNGDTPSSKYLVRWYHTHGKGKSSHRDLFSKSDYNSSKIVPISMSNAKGRLFRCGGDDSCSKKNGYYKGVQVKQVKINN